MKAIRRDRKKGRKGEIKEIKGQKIEVDEINREQKHWGKKKKEGERQKLREK
jgi:hypothetical protein